MHSLLDLHLLVDKFAAVLPDLNLDGDEQEEYSTAQCSCGFRTNSKRGSLVTQS